MSKFNKTLTRQAAEQAQAEQLTKQEQAAAQNLKTGLAIFFALAIVGAAFDVIA
jgi:hypothetical protein